MTRFLCAAIYLLVLFAAVVAGIAGLFLLFGGSKIVGLALIGAGFLVPKILVTFVPSPSFGEEE